MIDEVRYEVFKFQYKVGKSNKTLQKLISSFNNEEMQIKILNDILPQINDPLNFINLFSTEKIKYKGFLLLNKLDKINEINGIELLNFIKNFKEEEIIKNITIKSMNKLGTTSLQKIISLIESDKYKIEIISHLLETRDIVNFSLKNFIITLTDDKNKAYITEKSIKNNKINISNVFDIISNIEEDKYKLEIINILLKNNKIDSLTLKIILNTLLLFNDDDLKIIILRQLKTYNFCGNKNVLLRVIASLKKESDVFLVIDDYKDKYTPLEIINDAKNKLNDEIKIKLIIDYVDKKLITYESLINILNYFTNDENKLDIINKIYNIKLLTINQIFELVKVINSEDIKINIVDKYINISEINVDVINLFSDEYKYKIINNMIGNNIEFDRIYLMINEISNEEIKYNIIIELIRKFNKRDHIYKLIMILKEENRLKLINKLEFLNYDELKEILISKEKIRNFILNQIDNKFKLMNLKEICKYILESNDILILNSLIDLNLITYEMLKKEEFKDLFYIMVINYKNIHLNNLSSELNEYLSTGFNIKGQIQDLLVENQRQLLNVDVIKYLIPNFKLQLLKNIVKYDYYLFDYLINEVKNNNGNDINRYYELIREYEIFSQDEINDFYIIKNYRFVKDLIKSILSTKIILSPRERLNLKQIIMNENSYEISNVNEFRNFDIYLKEASEISNISIKIRNFLNGTQPIRNKKYRKLEKNYLEISKNNYVEDLIKECFIDLLLCNACTPNFQLNDLDQIIQINKFNSFKNFSSINSLDYFINIISYLKQKKLQYRKYMKTLINKINDLTDNEYGNLFINYMQLKNTPYLKIENIVKWKKFIMEQLKDEINNI